MENLNQKAAFLYFIEIITVYILILLSSKVNNVGEFFIFWYMVTVILNIVATFLLVRHKPKYYVALIFFGTLIVAVPLLFIYMLSQVRMC